jgi:transposase
MGKHRKHYTGEEKVAILRRHLLDKVPVSDLCEELGLQPTVFYRWQKEFFENGAAAFQQRGRTNHQPEQERIAYLEKKVQTKDDGEFLYVVHFSPVILVATWAQRPAPECKPAASPYDRVVIHYHPWPRIDKSFHCRDWLVY